MKKIRFLTDLNLKNKKVIVRTDWNVPFNKNKILDDTKIKLSLPTIKYLLQKNCKIIICTHLGRPKGKVNSKLSIASLTKELKKLLPKNKIIKLNNCIGKDIKEKIEKGKSKTIFVLENLRFYKEEMENDYAFAHSLANLADFYINDAFGVSHRKHASVSAITKFISGSIGFLFKEEIKHLNQVIKPKKPLTWIIGGAKLDKIELIEKALKKANHILIGGALAFSFLKAQGFHVGMSKTDTTSIRRAKKILKKRAAKKIVLPIDAVTASHSNTKSTIVSVNQMPTHQIGFDIGPKSVKLFKKYIDASKTIIWNGAVGYFEVKPFDKSTKSLANFLAKHSGVKIIGGGETSEMIRNLKLDKKMTHVSTGGGATLEFITTGKLAAISALQKNYKLFKK